MNLAFAPTDALLLVASLTPWKITEYNAIADYLSDVLGIKIRVLPLDYFKPHHSAVEDQNSREKNLEKKSSDAADTFNEFRAAKDRQKEGRYHRFFLNELAKNNIYFADGTEGAMEHTFLLVDDTTLALPNELWDAMLPKIEQLVVETSCKAEPCNEEGLRGRYTSVADIGPILASTGQPQFWAFVREIMQAANETGEMDLELDARGELTVYHQVGCNIKSLKDDVAAPFEALYAHTPLNVRWMEEDKQPSPIPTTEEFLCRPSDPEGVPVADYYGDFLLQNSTRRKIMDIICQKVLDIDPRAVEAALYDGKFQQSPFARAAHCVVTRKKRKIVQLTEGDVASCGSYRISDYRVQRKGVLSKFRDLNGSTGGVDKFKEALSASVSMNFSFGKKEQNGDALVLGPFDASNEKLRAYNTLMLRSALVAKALDSRYRFVPVVIMNKDGCWDDAIESIYAYANGGYSKNFILDPIHDRLPKGQQIVSSDRISHTALHACDILSGDSVDELNRAAVQVLAFRHKDYNRVGSGSKFGSKDGGTPRPENLFTATVFASASSDKLADHEIGMALGEQLAKWGCGLCTGGGDQHLMYAPIVGYKNGRAKGARHHLSCVSTHTIVAVETENGRLPPCDYWEMHDTIGPRLETLMSSDILISIGGGDGTGQETAYALTMKLLFPEEMADKKLVFIGEDAAMHAEIKSIIGKDAFETLLRSGALEDKGLYLFPDAESAFPIIKAAKDAFDAKHPQQPSFYISKQGEPSPLPA